MVESKSGAAPSNISEYSELSCSVHPIEGIGEFLRFAEAGFVALPYWCRIGDGTAPGLNQYPQPAKMRA